MAKSDTPTATLLDMMQSSLALFSATPKMTSQATHFWQAQDMFLNEFEQFATAWFKRRHEGTRAAMQMSRHLASGAMGNPAGATAILSDWQSHCMERLGQDAKDCTEMMNHCAAAFAKHEIEAVDETLETAQSVVKSAKSTPV